MNNQFETELPADVILDLLLRPKSVEQARIDAIGLDVWSAIISRLRTHRALPMLHHAMIERAELAVPDRVEKALVESAKQWGSRQVLAGRECLIMHQAFVKKGIPHLFLKGIPLSFDCYASPRLRPAQDVDILLHRENLQAARACIVDLGGGKIPVYQDLPDDPGKNGKHLPPIWSPNRIIPVELHSRIFDGTADHASPEMEAFADGLWKGATTFALSGADLPCANPLDMALHLISHSVYENFFSNGPLFLSDLQHMIERYNADPEQLLERANALGMGRGTALALQMLRLPVGEKAVSDELIETTSRLILQSGDDGDKRGLALVQFFQIDGLKSIMPFFRRVVPTKQHLLFLRREEGLEGGESWSYPRLWLGLLRDRVSKLRSFLGSARGRRSARHLVKVRGWLLSE